MPRTLVVEQVAALLGRPVDADLGDGLGVVAAAVDGPEQRAGNRAPSASSAIRIMPDFEVIGMIPATIGTWMPASSQRSRKS